MTPRVISICTFLDRGRILVFGINDEHGRVTGWRPLGGQVEWGERAADAVAREIAEEIGAEMTEVRLLGTLENLFEHLGEPGHEIVFVFDGRLADPALYEAAEIPGSEESGWTFTAVWKQLGEFEAAGGTPLYPEGLLDLLKEHVT